MVYIESHQALGSHPKTHKVARLLRISRPAAVGHLQFFWWWAMDYASDGDVTRFDPLDIAIGGAWEGDEATFVEALVASGFIDVEGDRRTIHDWDKYGGKLLKKRQTDADRKREQRNPQDDAQTNASDTESSDGHRTDIRRTAQVDKRREEESRETPSGVSGAGEPRNGPGTDPVDGNEADKAPTDPAGREPIDPAAPRSRKRASQRAAQMPDDFDLSTDRRAYAVDKGVPSHRVDDVWEAFVNYHRRTSNVMTDWSAAWRTWVLNERKFDRSRPPPGTNGQRPTHNGVVL